MTLAVSPSSPLSSTRDMDLVLEALLRKHGYDFRGYARQSLRRRMASLAGNLGLSGMSALAGRILEDDDLLSTILSGLTVSVTEMFRDPPAFAAFRPHLARLARRCSGWLSIWQAGCATGEESFSLLITLAEEGILEGARITATDLNGDVLRQAMAGCLPSRRLASATRAHAQSGGKGPLAEWFKLRGEIAWLDPLLLRAMTWRQHNLVSDAFPGELDVVVCRNVLTYFEQPLCERILLQFADSLRPGGLLWIGQKESLSFTRAGILFRCISDGMGMYQKL